MAKKKYDVLVPAYREAGTDKRGKMEWYVSWKKVGKADSMREAKKIVKHPVLSLVE